MQLLQDRSIALVDKEGINIHIISVYRCVERHGDSVIAGDDFQRTPEIGFLHIHLKASLVIIGYRT